MAEIGVILNEAEVICRELLDREDIAPKDIPIKPGVYMIRDMSHKTIYVGEAVNLKRRINDDHISGEVKPTTSSFRKKVQKKFGVKSGIAMRKWVKNNCCFTYVEVQDKQMRTLVEVLLICLLKRCGEPLLND